MKRNGKGISSLIPIFQHFLLLTSNLPENTLWIIKAHLGSRRQKCFNLNVLARNEVSKTGPFPGSGCSSSLMYHWSQRTKAPSAFSGYLPGIIIPPALVQCHLLSNSSVQMNTKPKEKKREQIKNRLLLWFHFQSARKRIGWEMLGRVLGMSLLMVLAKCAFGTRVIWSRGCFEALWKQPCSSAGRWPHSSKGGLSIAWGNERGWTLRCLICHLSVSFFFGCELFPCLLRP